MGCSHRLKTPYVQRCTIHSNVNFTPIFFDWTGVSTLAQWSLHNGKEQERPTTQLYMRNSSYFSCFDRMKALESLLHAHFGSLVGCHHIHFQSMSAKILNSRANGLLFLAICFCVKPQTCELVTITVSLWVKHYDVIEANMLRCSTERVCCWARM